MKIFCNKEKEKKVSICDDNWMIWYHRLHEYTRVYIHSKLHLQLGARMRKNWNWRENDFMSNNEHFGWSYFVWMFGDIYVCYRKISKIWHSQFSIQNVTSFFLLLEIFRVGRWIFKEYSRCDFFYTERTNGKNVWNLILGNVLDIL